MKSYNETDPKKLLERLRLESVEFIPSKGLFSPEFQSWHAAAIRVLRDCLGEADTLHQEFKNLQFEWPLEVLDSLHQTQVAFLENPEKQIDSSYKDAPPHFRKAMQDAMRKTLKKLPETTRKDLELVAPILKAAESQFMADAQQRRFKTAMEQAYEILGAAIIFCNQHKK